MTDDTSAFDAAASAAKGEPLGNLSYDGKDFPLLREPNGLLMAEMARLDSDDPEAFGVLVDFFEVVMGKPGYRAFRKAFFAHDYDSTESSVEALAVVMQEVVALTTGRPTK